MNKTISYLAQISATVILTATAIKSCNNLINRTEIQQVKSEIKAKDFN